MYKFVTFFILPLCLFSLVLFFAGYTEVTADGLQFRSFLTYLSKGYEFFSKYRIPRVGSISYMEPSLSASENNLTGLINFFITIGNVFVGFLNWLIISVNLLIEIIFFIFSLVYAVYEYQVLLIGY